VNLPANKRKKILIVGLKDTGKSSLLLKFLYDFPDASSQNVEESYFTSIKYKNQDYLLNLVDIAGMDEYTTLYPNRFSVRVDGYIFVYSVDDKKSFEYIQELREKLNNMSGKSAPAVLVGNKSDKNAER